MIIEMIRGFVSLAWSGFGGGAMGNMFAQWEASGVFSYMLPFLLIFAVIFGILTKTRIFKESKAINGIIAFVVALMALQFNFVSVFFAEIFPRMGVGLIVILAAMILLGMFAPNKTWVTIAFFMIGAVVLIVVLVNSGEAVGWSGVEFFKGILPDLLPWIIIIVAIAIVIISSVPQTKQDTSSLFMKSLFGTEKD